MDPLKLPTPFKDLSNTISTSVADTSNGGEPADVKERNRQRRQRYAHMDPEKKDELLKKRRESYQQKKAKLQSTPSVTGTRESHGGPSTLSQLQRTPTVKGYSGRNKENVAPTEIEAYQMNSPHMSSQVQESIVTETVDINNSYTDEPTSISIQTTPICPNELRRQRNKERNEQMDSTQREESLKRESERKRKQYAQMTTNEKNEVLARKHVAYQQKRLLADQIEASRARPRLHYDNMTPEQKRSKKARQEFRRNSLNKVFIAMENPC